jgi:hypothetical protein
LIVQRQSADWSGVARSNDKCTGQAIFGFGYTCACNNTDRGNNSKWIAPLVLGN